MGFQYVKVLFAAFDFWPRRQLPLITHRCGKNLVFGVFCLERGVWGEEFGVLCVVQDG